MGVDEGPVELRDAEDQVPHPLPVLARVGPQGPDRRGPGLDVVPEEEAAVAPAVGVVVVLADLFEQGVPLEAGVDRRADPLGARGPAAEQRELADELTLLPYAVARIDFTQNKST